MKHLMLIFLFLLFNVAAEASTTEEIERLLVVSSNEAVESKNQLIDPEVLEAKNKIRDQLVSASSHGLSLRSAQSQTIETLIDSGELVLTQGKILKDPRTIDDWGMSHANVSDEVWSGPAWSQYHGHTAQRYNLPKARSAPSWQDAWKFVSAPGRTLFDVATGVSREIVMDDLSPAEKYDLLIVTQDNLREGLFSKYEWEQGRNTLARTGKVPKWFGYCHGWAAASFMLPRPTSAIEVLAADAKTKVRFYPFDIKALETALWANAMPTIRVVGHRCDISNPKRDENGRITDDACLDVNPGLFHLALVNELGSAQRNLIIDATYDQEIWNQPIEAYSYRYFNPQTGKAGGSLEVSSVNINDFTKDKFKKYRAPEARTVVGVSMDIVYGRGVIPNHNPKNNSGSDAKRKVTYLYDLELDQKGEIIGGEWYQLRHPDFIWVPEKNSHAESAPEKAVAHDWEPWTPAQGPVPSSWRDPAIQSAAAGAPLARIVDQLVRESRNASN